MKNLQYVRQARYTKGFVPLFLLAVVAIAAIAFGGYAIIKNQKISGQAPVTPNASIEATATVTVTTTSPTPSPTLTNKPVTAATTQNSSDPKQAYLHIRQQFENVTTFSDFLALTLKYGSQNNIAKIQTEKAQIDALPQAFKDAVVTQLKAMLPGVKELTAITVATSGNAAVLTVGSTRPGMTGTVTMVNENGQWKLDNETWKSSGSTTVQ